MYVTGSIIDVTYGEFIIGPSARINLRDVINDIVYSAVVVL